MDEKPIKPIYKDVLKADPVAVQEEGVAEAITSSEEETTSYDVPEGEKVRPEDIDPNEPLFHVVADYLNITDQRDYGDAIPKVKYIVDWVVKEVGPNYEDVISKISDLTHMISKPDFDVKLYKHIYRYVRLKEQDKAIKKALSAWEGRKIDNGEQGE